MLAVNRVDRALETYLRTGKLVAGREEDHRGVHRRVFLLVLAALLLGTIVDREGEIALRG